MKVVLNGLARAAAPLAEARPTLPPETAKALRAARLKIVPEDYARTMLVSMMGAGVAGGLLVGTLVTALTRGDLALGATAAALGAGLFLLFTRTGFLLYPGLVAGSRGRRIDAEFPSVVTLCYALARGGMPSVQIFRVVAEERDVYGEISEEFQGLVQRIDLLGLDVNAALHEVAAVTPSQRLREFLTGLVTMLESGADARDYFHRQAEVQLTRGEQDAEAELEQGAMLAEMYVSGFLVLPLLLMVVMSVMSALGDASMSGFIPVIVFGLIPLGTGGFLVLLDTLLPPSPLKTPPARPGLRVDAGMHTLPLEAPRLPPTRDDAHDDPHKFAGFRMWFESRARDFTKRAIGNPWEALQVSALVSTIVLAFGAAVALLKPSGDHTLLVSLTGALGATLLAAILPVGIFHEIRVRRARRVEESLPEVLSRLAGFNERGIGLLRAFHILGKSTKGPLAKEIRALDRDVRWNGSLRNGLLRFRERVETLRVTKLAVLLERASAVSGNLKDVLEVAAKDAANTEKMMTRKKQSMMSYVIVIYVVFGVFLYTLYMTTSLFYGAEGLAAAAAGSGSGGGIASAPSTGMAPEKARLLYFHAVIIQGTSCGLVAGKLGEGHLLSGLKHAAILGTLGWLVFRGMGVVP